MFGTTSADISYKKAIEAENAAARFRLTILNDLREKISRADMGGTVVMNGSAAIVTISTIMADKRLILTPGYYIPTAQAKAVCDKLRIARTIEEMTKSVTEMADSRCVTGSCGQIPLNHKTIEILKASKMYCRKEGA